MKIEITDKLYKDIYSYCSLNDLNVDEYVNDLLKKSFTIEKYGARPHIIQVQTINESPAEKIDEGKIEKEKLAPKKTVKPKVQKQKPVVQTTPIKADPLADEDDEAEVKPKRRKLS